MSIGQKRMGRRGVPTLIRMGNVDTDTSSNLVEIGFDLGVSASGTI